MIEFNKFKIKNVWCSCCLHLKKTKSDDNNKKEHVVKQETAAMCYSTQKI